MVPRQHRRRAPGRSGRAIDAAALSKLRWRCRRGLLENDLLLERLFTRAMRRSPRPRPTASTC